ncbi:MAG: portal protein [Alphaproteobacteria bacterium]
MKKTHIENKKDTPNIYDTIDGFDDIANKDNRQTFDKKWQWDELWAVEKRYHQAYQQRQEWFSWWRECYQYALPQYDMVGDFAPQQNAVYDSTAVLAVEQLASNLVQDLLPHQKRWFDFVTLNDDGGIKKSLAQLADNMAQELQNSNFYLEVHQAMLDLVVAGTAVLAVEKNDRGGVGFRAIPMTSIILEDDGDHHGNQQAAVFKQSRLSIDKIKTIWDNNGYDKKLTEKYIKQLAIDADDMIAVVEALLPNEDGAVDYILFVPSDSLAKDVGGGQTIAPMLINHGRFRQMPLLVFRFTKAPGEIYGRSPVMRALPDIITANQVVELILKNASLNVSGIWLVDDDGVINVNNLKLEPGAIIQKAVGSPGLTPLRTAGLDLSQVVLGELRDNIKKALLSDNILAVDRMASFSKKTATEVREISESQTRMLVASYRRLEHELLYPLIHRLLGIMVDEGRAPLWISERQKIKLVISSPLERRQEMREAENMLSLLQTANAVGLDLTPYIDRAELVKKLFHYFQLTLPSYHSNDKTDEDVVHKKPANNIQHQDSDAISPNPALYI